MGNAARRLPPQHRFFNPAQLVVSGKTPILRGRAHPAGLEPRSSLHSAQTTPLLGHGLAIDVELASVEPAAQPLEKGVLALGKRLYVGNLGYKVTSSDLESLFAAFGTVDSAQVVQDRESGRSKGFGFVDMGTDQEAQAAIQGLNGKDHEGRPLTVNEARPREERGGGGGRGGYGGGRGRY